MISAICNQVFASRQPWPGDRCIHLVVTGNAQMGRVCACKLQRRHGWHANCLLATQININLMRLTKIHAQWSAMDFPYCDRVCFNLRCFYLDVSYQEIAMIELNVWKGDEGKPEPLRYEINGMVCFSQCKQCWYRVRKAVWIFVTTTDLCAEFMM